ncbi:hypothetical protein [Novosphingobium sp.]|uniref:hypothetical protein n=1 Tax=Novosphingobium sp. TaxID=1874826 RepID=UPI0025D8E0F6|nr:hypothetical protein [Novosphingobium sp.]MCC6924864.1 hypothetical protein [Novosphingobium sp.]
MRTHLEFNSTLFEEPEGVGNTYNPEIQGAKLADFLSREFKALGYSGAIIEEDWGWMVDLGGEQFPTWLGCASYSSPNGWLVFIEPSQPFVRKWLKKIDTQPAVTRIAEQLETLLTTKGGATGLNWWSDQDSGRK